MLHSFNNVHKYFIDLIVFQVIKQNGSQLSLDNEQNTIQTGTQLTAESEVFSLTYYVLFIRSHTKKNYIIDLIT